MARVREWSDDEVMRLKSLYGTSMTFEEINKEFSKRTGNAIRLKASRLGLRRQTIPDDIIQARPLQFKSGNGDEDGYLLKCNKCETWIQVDEDVVEESNLLNCGNCGSIFKVLNEI